MSTYAIISVAGKQYRVRQGQRLLVDRLPYPESATFHPPVLLVGGEGRAELSPSGAQVTATVVRNVLGDKIRIGKYKPKTGYRRHRGYRRAEAPAETARRRRAPAAATAAEESERKKAAPRGKQAKEKEA